MSGLEVRISGFGHDVQGSRVQSSKLSGFLLRLRPPPSIPELNLLSHFKVSDAAHVRQSRPEPGLGFQIKFFFFKVVPFSLGRGSQGPGLESRGLGLRR